MQRVTPQCRELHKGRYVATEYRGTLIVHKNGNTRGGRHILPPESKNWIEAITTALDGKEADLLCKAVLQCR